MTYEPIDGRLLVSVVIPVYFEEKTIGSIVERCLPFADEVLVINDRSTDYTVKVARAVEAKGVDLIENKRALGATQVGLREASGDMRARLGYTRLLLFLIMVEGVSVLL
jgi:glycosyltransferase involved in cell wall biosynthesis